MVYQVELELATVTTTEREVKPKGIGLGGSGNGFRNNGGGNGGDNNRNSRPTPNKYRLGMWLAMAAIMMMFMSITSAYVIREGKDWQPMTVPSALWVSTGVLLASSFTFEWASRALRRGFNGLFKQWLIVTTLLGFAFLVGQLLAWRQLVLKGIYLSTNPHSSFFYLLTSLHGLHLLGGVFALLWLVSGALRNHYAPERRTAEPSRNRTLRLTRTVFS